MTMTTLAPVSKDARRLAARELGRKAVTDRQAAEFWSGRNVEFREIPHRLQAIDRLIEEAWDLVHRLKRSGVKWAGTARQATMTIAGTAYAAWRCNEGRTAGPDEDDQATAVAAAMVAGVEMALATTEGIAALWAAEYARVTAGSRDPLDGVPPLKLLARVWPGKYAGGQLRQRPPRYAEWGDVEPGELRWSEWAAAPNPLTATPAALRRAVAGIDATERRAVAKRKPR